MSKLTILRSAVLVCAVHAAAAQELDRAALSELEWGSAEVQELTASLRERALGLDAGDAAQLRARLTTDPGEDRKSVV